MFCPLSLALGKSDVRHGGLLDMATFIIPRKGGRIKREKKYGRLQEEEKDES